MDQGKETLRLSVNAHAPMAIFATLAYCRRTVGLLIHSNWASHAATMQIANEISFATLVISVVNASLHMQATRANRVELNGIAPWGSNATKSSRGKGACAD